MVSLKNYYGKQMTACNVLYVFNNIIYLHNDSGIWHFLINNIAFIVYRVERG